MNPPPSSSPPPLGWAKHSSVWLNLLNTVEPRITRVAGSVVRRADARTGGHIGHRHGLGPRKPCVALKESEKGPYSRLTAVGGQKRVRGLTDCRSYSNKHAYIRTLGVGKTSASATRRFQRLSTSPDGTSWHLRRSAMAPAPPRARQGVHDLRETGPVWSGGGRPKFRSCFR